jgi:mannonate dehydratase
MTKLSMVAVPMTDERLAAISQVGVEGLVHYDMGNDPGKFDRLESVVARAAKFGLRVPVVEAGPPIDRIVLGGEGAAGQIEGWKRDLARLGRLGVEVVCYNFMPQVLDDAMVVRTSLAARTRGGAETSAFRLADLPPSPREPAVSADRMRENLARFLAAVVPAAEAAGVKLAMHPDDPPMSPLGGYARIMGSVESFDWLLALHPSPMNGITLCTGCFGELCIDVPALVKRFGPRIHFVHLRNIRGRPEDFMETFPDDGDVDLVGTLAALEDAGFAGYARPDHSPRLATEVEGTPGYGFDGHLFTLGYLRGVLDGLKQGRAA